VPKIIFFIKVDQCFTELFSFFSETRCTVYKGNVYNNFKSNYFPIMETWKGDLWWLVMRNNISNAHS